MEAGSTKQPSHTQQIPIITRSVKGKFRTLKTSVLILAYMVFFGMPWLPWVRHSAANQAIMFDLGSRRFFVFDLVVYPQDIFWLSMLLFIAAALLFFVTGLVGRAWCGFFCFQTLWSDFFTIIEHKLQGERPARMRLRKQAWNTEKVLKVGGAHALMLLVSFWTGFTFIAYFSYAPDLLDRFFNGHAAQVAYFTVLLLTLSTYAAAGIARELVCVHVCPYARFQSAMCEADTLTISYDVRTGEGVAGRVAPGEGMRTLEERQKQGHGTCIDCGFCIQVCPTGIDIRNGSQHECISCGLCVDACNNIMESANLPKGLIRYDSDRNLRSEHPGKPHLEWKRLKVLGYASALLVMIGALGWNIASRSDTEVGIQQVRQPLYVELADESIRNRYQIHLVNKTEQDQTFSVTVQGIPAKALDLGALNEIKVRSGKSLMVAAKVDLDALTAKKTRSFEFVIKAQTPDAQEIMRKVDFTSPH